MAVMPGLLRQSNHADERSVRPGWRMIFALPFSAVRLSRVSSSWLRLRRACSSLTQSSIWMGFVVALLLHEQPSQDWFDDQGIACLLGAVCLGAGVLLIRSSCGEDHCCFLYLSRMTWFLEVGMSLSYWRLGNGRLCTRERITRDPVQ